MTILQEKTAAFLSGGIKTVAHQDQQRFMRQPYNTTEGGLRNMIEGLEAYCGAIYTDYETHIGDDYFLKQYVEEIAHGIRGLLSGPGRFDGGTLDSTLIEIADTHGLEIE